MYRLLTDASIFDTPRAAAASKGNATLLVPAGHARGGIDAPRPPRVHLLATRDGRQVRLHRGDWRRRRARTVAQPRARFAAPSSARDSCAADGAERQRVGTSAGTNSCSKSGRNRNAYFAAPLAHDATDATSRALAQTVATGRILALAETSGFRFTTTTGCQRTASRPSTSGRLQDRNRRGRVTQGGSVRLLLPATLGDIPGAETQTPDIRDQPGGDALFQFWMENRRKEDERLGRDRERAGVGVGDGVGDGAPRARSQLQLSSLATS